MLKNFSLKKNFRCELEHTRSTAGKVFQFYTVRNFKRTTEGMIDGASASADLSCVFTKIQCILQNDTALIKQILVSTGLLAGQFHTLAKNWKKKQDVS